MALILFFNFVSLATLIRHKTQLFASGRYRNREEAALNIFTLKSARIERRYYRHSTDKHF